MTPEVVNRLTSQARLGLPLMSGRSNWAPLSPLPLR